MIQIGKYRSFRHDTINLSTPFAPFASDTCFYMQATFVARAWLGSGIETLVLGGCCAGLAYEIGSVVATCVGVMD